MGIFQCLNSFNKKAYSIRMSLKRVQSLELKLLMIIMDRKLVQTLIRMGMIQAIKAPVINFTLISATKKLNHYLQIPKINKSFNFKKKLIL